MRVIPDDGEHLRSMASWTIENRACGRPRDGVDQERFLFEERLEGQAAERRLSLSTRRALGKGGAGRDKKPLSLESDEAAARTCASRYRAQSRASHDTPARPCRPRLAQCSTKRLHESVVAIRLATFFTI